MKLIIALTLCFGLLMTFSCSPSSLPSPQPSPSPPLTPSGCRCEPGCFDLKIGVRYAGFQKCGIGCCGCFNTFTSYRSDAISLRDFCTANFGYDTDAGPDGLSLTAYCLNTPTSTNFPAYPTCYNACSLTCTFAGYAQYEQLIPDQACSYQARLCVNNSPSAQIIP